HADHIGGLEYLALFNRYIAQSKKRPKLKMIVTKKYQKILWECSLRGGMEWNETSSSGEKLNFPDYFVPVYPKLIKRSPRLIYELDFDGIHFELFGTNHIPDNAQTQKQAFPSFGLFVDNRLMISCDTKFDPELISRYADRSEVMFHDTSMQPNPVHASLPQLQTLPADIKKKIYLMHYGDDWAKYDISEFAGFARQGFRYIFD
ncbi:MAG: hypothetical protein QG635_2204, partial [Bacteroidota bacterium]|nr:hypothetical protein [Bacteroidota bacterium]